MSACAPLYEALMRHRQTEQVSLHMPGTRAGGCLAPLGKLPIFDVTELPSTGSLFDAEGPTLLAEQAAAKPLARQARFFPQADARFVSRLCYALPLHWGNGRHGPHCSPQRGSCDGTARHYAHMGLAPARRRAWPCRENPGGRCGKALQKHPDAKAVYLTTPDYYA